MRGLYVCPEKSFANVEIVTDMTSTINQVQQEIVDMSDEVVEIPQYGTKHSLNISVSVGVVLWEYAKKLKIC